MARIRSCYISAPAASNLKVLRDALNKRGIRVTVPFDVPAGTNWSTTIPPLLAPIDLFIGVLTAERRSDWVLFELGMAWTAKTRSMLIVPPKGIPYFPLDSKGLLTVRTSLSNRQAIEFALDQLLAAPETAPLTEPQPVTGEGLGDRADEYIRQVTAALNEYKPLELEQIVERALRESGVEALSADFKEDRGADVAVWSDALQESVGNPLLIEVKTHVRDRRIAQQAASQLSKQIASSGTRWGLLLYGTGPSLASIRQTLPPNVLAITIPDLFERMRHRPFAEVVGALRNERVHGISE